MKKNYFILLFILVVGMIIIPSDVMAEEKTYPSNCNYYNAERTFKMYCTVKIDGTASISCGYEYNTYSNTKLQLKVGVPANWSNGFSRSNLMDYISNNDDINERKFYKTLSSEKLMSKYYIDNATCPKYALMWTKDPGSVTQDSDYSFVLTNDDNLNTWKSYIKDEISNFKEAYNVDLTEYDLTYESNTEHNTNCKTDISDFATQVAAADDPTEIIKKGDEALCYCASSLPKTDVNVNNYLNARDTAVKNKNLSVEEFIKVCPRYDNRDVMNEEENPENDNIIVNWDSIDYDTCESLLGDPNNDETLAGMINKFFGYFKILAPIIVLLLSSVEFIKAIVQNDDDTMKKAQKRLMIRIFIAIALFLVPTLVMVLLKLFNIVSDTSCIK